MRAALLTIALLFIPLAAGETGIAVFQPANNSAWLSSQGWNTTNWTASANLTELVRGTAVRWVRLANNPLRDELAVATLDSSQAVKVQFLSNTTNSSPLNITNATGDAGFRAFDLAVDGNGTLMVVAAANSSGGLVYRRWNSTWFENGSISTGLSAQVRWARLAARNNSADLLLVTQDSNSDLVATPWNGTSWLASQSLDNDTEQAGAEDFDVAYEPVTGRALVVWANASTAAPRYRIYSGSWSSVGSVSTSSGQSANYEWLRLKAFPGTDRLLLCTTDASADLNCAQWDGSVWGTDAELDASIENDAPARRNMDLAPEPAGGGWAVLYGDSNLDYYSFARCQTASNCANGVWEAVQTFWSAVDIGTDTAWAALEADPLLAGNLTALMTDQTGQQWRGTIQCTSAANSCASTGMPGLLAISNTSSNESAAFVPTPVRPNLTAPTASPATLKGGDTVTIDAGALADVNNNSLSLFCSESGLPGPGLTNCTGGTTTDSSPPYNLTCTYTVPADTATHTVTCRVSDSLLFSANASTSYTTDSTPPSTSVVSVAGDSQSPYYDASNDGWTNISVSGEGSMTCRWAASDLGYSAMSNSCTTAGTQATCGIATSSQGAASYSVSCADSLGNGQNSTQNLDITSLVLDWTAPTTSDNSTSAVSVPPVAVLLTESDNVDGDPATYYCTDTFGNCAPTTSTDTLTRINFTTRGANFLRYYSVDDAGNNQSVQNKTINVNRLPALSSAEDNASTIGPSWLVNITTNSSDPDGSTLQLFVCQTNSATAAGCAAASYCNDTASAANSTCSFAAESDNAAHTWYAFLFDSLNESAPANGSGSYTVDSAGPAITLLDPANSTYSTGTVPLSLTTSEAASWASYSLDGAANVTLSNSSQTFWSATLAGLADGQHNVSFFANDTVNNHNSSAVRLFRVDSTATDTIAPTITILSPATGWFRTANITLNISLSEAASNASYVLAGTNLSLGNISPTLWNATTALLADGNHTVTFFANDTATLRNTGSATASFATDTTPPAFSSNGTTPSAANDTANVTCHSFWSDAQGIDFAIVQENATGAAYNHSTRLAGSSGWGNSTINDTALVPGAVQCVFYANDSAGNWNSTSVLFAVADATPPNLTVTLYTPNTTAGLDPGVPVNVTATAADNVAVANATLQYREANASAWTPVNMTLSSGAYNASFTPTNGVWTFRVMANDTSDNSNTSAEANVTVLQDETWTNASTIASITSIVQTDPRAFSLGNLTLNATGDVALNFSLSSNTTFLSFNGTNSTLNTTLNASNANLTSNATFNVTANTTGFATGSYAYRLQILVDRNGTRLSNQTIDGAILIQNVAGPYLVATITAYETAVTQGASNITLTATVQNLGTTAATDVWLNWSLPAGFSNSSGLGNRSIGFLAVGSTATSSIGAAVSSSASTGARTLSVFASSAEAAFANDSKSVTVNALGETAVAAAASSGGSGGGGSGATIATGRSLSEFIQQSSESLDVVRGDRITFPLTIKNIFRGSLQDVHIALAGVLPRYLSIEPASIPSIPPGSSASFQITVTAPGYTELGTRELTATITGTILPERTPLREQRTLTLFIQPLSLEDLRAALAAAAAALEELSAAGFGTALPGRLLERAQAAAAAHDFGTALSLTGEISGLRTTAFEVQGLSARIRQSLASADQRGLDAPETADLLNLALAAAGREDYATAKQRLEQAELLYGLETKGRINLLNFLQQYWHLILIALALAILAFTFASRRLAVRRISSTLRELDIEEAKIHDLIRAVQRQTFEQKTMSSATYHKQMYHAEKRLDEIHAQRARLRAKRIGLLSASSELENLGREAGRLEAQMKQAQRQYYIAGDIGRKAYEARMRRLHEHEAELEAGIAVLEARVAQERAASAAKRGPHPASKPARAQPRRHP